MELLQQLFVLKIQQIKIMIIMEHVSGGSYMKLKSMKLQQRIQKILQKQLLLME